MGLAAIAQPAGSDYERHILRKLEILRYDHSVFEAANRSHHSMVALTFTITKDGTASDLRISPQPQQNWRPPFSEAWSVSGSTSRRAPCG